MSSYPTPLGLRMLPKRHPFISKFKDTFISMYKEMCKHASPYIVAIARKGPRLFDFFENDIEKTSICPTIVSDRAVPYLDFTKVEKVPLFDDIVIFGSTMKDRMRELEMTGVTPVPYSLAYDLDEAAIKVNYGKVLHKEIVPTFCDDIVSAFQLLAKPYDLDHPVFSFVPMSLDTFNQFREEISNKLGAHYFADLTSSLQRKNDILNLVFLYPSPFQLESLFTTTCSVRPSGLYKIRIFYDKRKEKLTITPMLIFYISFKDHNEAFFRDDLTVFNEIIDKAKETISFYPKQKMEQELYRLIFYLIEYIYGVSFISSFNYFSHELKLNLKDVYYLYGDKFGRYLIKELESKSTQIVNKLLDERLPSRQTSLETGKIENSGLYQEIFGFKEKEYERLNKRLKWSNEVSSLWNICRLLRVKDTITRRPEELQKPGRLNFGFTFQDLRRILSQKMKVMISSEVLSPIIDYFIDRGVLIPIFLKYPTNYWVRAYRFGENLNGYPEKNRAYFMCYSLTRLFEHLKVSSISQFDFEKFLAFLIQVFKQPPGSFLRFKELDLDIVFDEFGARPITKGFRASPSRDGLVSAEKRFLFQEAQDNEVIEKFKTSSGTRIRLSKNFDVVHPSTLNPLSEFGPEINLYTDLWAELIYRLDIGERKDELMVLFTTCNNKSNFLTTYKAGIESWFSHDFSRFPKILKEVKILLNLKSMDSELYKQKVKEIDRELLHDNATRLIQCENKRRVWEKRTQIIEKIEEAMAGRLFVEPLFKKIKGLIFDFSPLSNKEEQTYVYLRELFEICRASTNVLRSALIERQKGELERYVEAYNLVIEKVMNLPGLSHLSEISEKDQTKIVRVLEYNHPILFTFFETYIKKREKYLIDEVGIDALRRAIELSKQCTPEDEKIRPKVGAVIVKNGVVIGEGYRNMDGRGCHAEEIAIKNCKGRDLEGAILVTTMEPCTVGDHKVSSGDLRISCATMIAEYRMKGVIWGMLDPNSRIRGNGIRYLSQWGIMTESFPADMQEEILKINKEYISQFPDIKPKFDYK